MISFATHVRDQPDIFSRHIAEWDKFPQEVLDQLEFIVVDDCSTEHAVEVQRPYLKVLLSRDQMPWNYGIKNLLAQEAKYDWVLETNIDHLLTLPCALQLLELNLERHKYYRPLRYNFNEGDDSRWSGKPHIGTLLIHKDDLWSVGGYDEDFSGHYGHEDGFLKHCLAANGVEEVLLPSVVLRNYSNGGEISDADFIQNPQWDRDLVRNNALFEKKKRGKPRASKPLIRFAWSYGPLVWSPNEQV